MAPTKKSIYRQPGSQHFQLVHRSVRDPLINDPAASKQVFKPVGRANDKASGDVTLDDLQAEIDPSQVRANEGEASGYGITYDDSAYDYMQHLKPVGEGGADSVLLAAPRGSGVAPGMKNQGQKGKMKREEDMFQMPDEVLASRNEVSVADVHAQQQAIPPELQGFQPDMNPHLRQVLEALDDDEFIEDGDADVFGELLGSGETDDPEVLEDFEFAEWGVPEGEEYEDEEDDDDARTEDGKDGETWEDRYRAFKAAGGRPAAPVSNGGWESDGDAERSEMADTVGSLVSGMGDMMVKGGKKRHGKRGPSDASGMSMSSASVYRNSNLRTLDDQFDHMEREYDIDDEDDEEWAEDEDDGMSMAPSNMSSMSRVSFLRGDEPTGAGPGAPEISRDDFESIMDDFLDNYEVVGNRMRESLGTTGLSGPDKLKVLRSALEDGEQGPSQEDNRRRIFDLERRIQDGTYKEEQDALERSSVVKDKDQWDVETILSTYTNTENIPGTIRLRSAAESQARAKRRAEAAAAAAAIAEREEEEDATDSGSETEREAKVTVTRAKGESAEERKARKSAVKAERASRRAEKKQHKQTFGDERKRQLASQKKMVSNGRAADMSVGSRGVVSLS